MIKANDTLSLVLAGRGFCLTLTPTPPSLPPVSGCCSDGKAFLGCVSADL